MQVGVNKLFRAGTVPARTWRVHAVGMAPTERLKLRRQMAAAAVKMGTIPLYPFSWRLLVRITVFSSAIVIDVIVHCHTAGAL